MPIYEYQCDKCGPFEVTQRITDAPLRRCPECRSKVRKLISQTSFQLKGTGWYVTDYASKDGGSDKSDKSEKSGTETKSKSSDSASTSSKSDTKASPSTSKGEATAA